MKPTIQNISYEIDMTLCEYFLLCSKVEVWPIINSSLWISKDSQFFKSYDSRIYSNNIKHIEHVFSTKLACINIS